MVAGPLTGKHLILAITNLCSANTTDCHAMLRDPLFQQREEKARLWEKGKNCDLGFPNRSHRGWRWQCNHQR